MALTDENGGNGFYMPVAPAYGGGYGNNGGFFGGDWAWILLLLLIGGNGWGFGGLGGMAGMVDGGFGLYPWLNNSQHISDGFRDQSLQTSISGLQNSVTSGFGDVQNALCGGFAGVNAGIANAAAQAEISANARQMANMQQLFGIQSAQQQCCCDTRAGIADLRYTVATEACADRAAVGDALQAVTMQGVNNTNALMTTLNNGFQSIKDQLCADKIEQKNDLIAQLRSELMYARGQASQDVQTATIQAGQRALANEVEQYVLPTPRPAYIVQNPNCCTPYTGCGCGCTGFAA